MGLCYRAAGQAAGQMGHGLGFRGLGFRGLGLGGLGLGFRGLGLCNPPNNGETKGKEHGT